MGRVSYFKWPRRSHVAKGRMDSEPAENGVDLASTPSFR